MKYLLKVGILTIILFSFTLNKAEAAEGGSDIISAATTAGLTLAYNAAGAVATAYIAYKPFRDDLNRYAQNFGKGVWNLATRCNWAGRENPFDKFFNDELSKGVAIPERIGRGRVTEGVSVKLDHMRELAQAIHWYTERELDGRQVCTWCTCCRRPGLRVYGNDALRYMVIPDGEEDFSWYVRFGRPSRDIPIEVRREVSASPYTRIKEETFIRASSLITRGEHGRYASLFDGTVISELGKLEGNVKFYRRPLTVNPKTEIAAEDFSSEAEAFIAVIGMWKRGTDVSRGAAAPRTPGTLYFLPIAQIEVILPMHKAEEIEHEVEPTAAGSRRGSVIGGGSILLREEDGDTDRKIFETHERLGALLRARAAPSEEEV